MDIADVPEKAPEALEKARAFFDSYVILVNKAIIPKVGEPLKTTRG